jgi:alpha/beta superfamily hydrolase
MDREISKLEKQEQAKHKTSRKIVVIKIRAEINEIETKIKPNQTNQPNKQKTKNETGSCFFEKINKLDNPLANLTKLRREKDTNY